MGTVIHFPAKRAKPWELHKPTAAELEEFCERYRLSFPVMELLLVQGAGVKISWPRDNNDREGLVITGVDPHRRVRMPEARRLRRLAQERRSPTAGPDRKLPY